ncbi:MAG: pilus assembly protein [Deltaproteobacteria bacterium]|nr:MAG: pilus assembly protein [Deltaproteobacteria bacterium]
MGKSLKFWAKGQAIIEFTLMLPIIITVLAGLTDLGLALYLAIATQNAVREGARLAARGVNSSTVKSQVISGIPATSQFNITTADITVTGPTTMSGVTGCTNSSGGSAPQSKISVTATGTYNYAFLKYVGFTTQTISRTGIMRYEGSTASPESLCH